MNARGLRQVDEKIPRLVRGMHLSVVYPVYRASGAYRLNNTGATPGEWQGWRSNEGRGGRDSADPGVRRSTAIRPKLIRRRDTPLNSLKWDYVSAIVICDGRRSSYKFWSLCGTGVFSRRLASPRLALGRVPNSSGNISPDRAGRVLRNNCL